MDDTDSSNEECNREECLRLRAQLARLHDRLEDWLEMAQWNGKVVVSEKVLDDLLAGVG